MNKIPREKLDGLSLRKAVDLLGIELDSLIDTKDKFATFVNTLYDSTIKSGASLYFFVDHVMTDKDNYIKSVNEDGYTYAPLNIDDLTAPFYLNALKVDGNEAAQCCIDNNMETWMQPRLEEIINEYYKD